jgi:hypothetical protein
MRSWSSTCSYVLSALLVLAAVMMHLQPREGFANRRRNKKNGGGGGSGSKGGTKGAQRSSSGSGGPLHAPNSRKNQNNRGITINNHIKNVQRGGGGHRGGHDRWYDGYNGYYDRPFQYWSNFVEPPGWFGWYPPGYYPSAYGLSSPYDRYDYLNAVFPRQSLCYARIGVHDAFGPYVDVIGKQQWLDWAGRNGFPKIWLDKRSYTNDHAIVFSLSDCPQEAQKPPGRHYQMYDATPYYF